MTGLAILGFIIVALAVLDIAALRWGVDSRIGFDNGSTRTSLLS
ncbi:MAG: hypothetical protein V4515_08715 [Chloroflexota bacterium]